MQNLDDIEARVIAATRHGQGTYAVTDAIIGGKTRVYCKACDLQWPHDIDWHAVVTGEGEMFIPIRCGVSMTINNEQYRCQSEWNHYGEHKYNDDI